MTYPLQRPRNDKIEKSSGLVPLDCLGLVALVPRIQQNPSRTVDNHCHTQLAITLFFVLDHVDLVGSEPQMSQYV